jgi:hypothetical protein
MKTNWTTAKGSKIELETNNNNGLRSTSTLWVNGIEYKSSLQKVNGTWAAKMNAQFVAIPAAIMATIEADRDASRNQLTAEQIEAVNKNDRIAAAKAQMDKVADYDNMAYLKARDEWFAALKA